MCMLTFIRMSMIMSLILSVWPSHPDLNIHYEVTSGYPSYVASARPGPWWDQFDTMYSVTDRDFRFSIFNLV